MTCAGMLKLRERRDEALRGARDGLRRLAGVLAQPPQDRRVGQAPLALLRLGEGERHLGIARLGRFSRRLGGGGRAQRELHAVVGGHDGLGLVGQHRGVTEDLRRSGDAVDEVWAGGRQRVREVELRRDRRADGSAHHVAGVDRG